MRQSYSPTELNEMARRWGKDPSYVRRAVDRGLIPTATAQGHPGGLGVRWLYDVQARRALRALLQLDAQGYRGKGLRFALWWMGLMPWTEDVPAFVIELGREARTIARDRLIERSISNESTILIQPRIASNGTVALGDNEEYADPQWARQQVENPLIRKFGDVFADLLRSVSGVAVDPQIFLPVGFAVVAAVLGVSAIDIGLDPSNQAAELTRLLAQLPSSDSEHVVANLPTWLNLLVSNQWYDDALLSLERVPHSGWDAVRRELRDNPEDRAIMRWVLQIARAARRHGAVPRRMLARHPAIRYPSVLVVAIMVATRLSTKELLAGIDSPNALPTPDNEIIR